MALGFRACWSFCVNILVNPAEELNELAGAQCPARRSKARSNVTSIPPEASTLPFIFSTSKDLFTKFMKMFKETTQAQDQLKPRKRPLKARISETYSRKSHIDCYHFCQQFEDYLKTSGATKINRISFAAIFLRGSISLRWAQHKYCYKRATFIRQLKFKAFLQKDLVSCQAFIDSIWSKFKKDFQYQLEEAQDWASHLQHI